MGQVPVPCLLAQRWAHGALWSKVLFFSAESVPGPDFQHYWTENPREVLGPEGSSGATQLWIMSWLESKGKMMGNKWQPGNK